MIVLLLKTRKLISRPSFKILGVILGLDLRYIRAKIVTEMTSLRGSRFQCVGAPTSISSHRSIVLIENCSFLWTRVRKITFIVVESWDYDHSHDCANVMISDLFLCTVTRRVRQLRYVMSKHYTSRSSQPCNLLTQRREAPSKHKIPIQLK